MTTIHALILMIFIFWCFRNILFITTRRWRSYSRLVGFVYKFWVKFISFFQQCFIVGVDHYVSLAVEVILLMLHSIAECFAFLVCTKWYNPAIHRQSCIREPSSSTTAVRYLDWSRGIVVVGDDDQQQNCRMCNLQTIGGHIMKIPFICFQIMLFMYLEVLQILKSVWSWIFKNFYAYLSFFCHVREHRLELEISHYGLFLLLFFCYKPLEFCLLYIDYSRKFIF